MTDNTNKEELNKPINTQSENSPDEVPHTDDQETINQNQAAENMEVHKHSHHVMHKKKWGEYLLEFFMLFLAVFLGFVAENIRENISDRHKEKEYIRALIKDLKTDTSKIAQNQKGYKFYTDKLDTLIFMNSFDSIDTGISGRIYMLLNVATGGFPDFIYTDGTIQQLKNAGGFRLIENKNAIDSIMAYDAEVKRALINEGELNEDFKAVKQARQELINYRALGIAFRREIKSGKTMEEIKNIKFECVLPHDPAAKDRLFNKLFDYQQLMFILMNMNYKSVKKTAASLIVFLTKEYHLEKE